MVTRFDGFLKVESYAFKVKAQEKLVKYLQKVKIMIRFFCQWYFPH